MCDDGGIEAKAGKFASMRRAGALRRDRTRGLCGTASQCLALGAFRWRDFDARGATGRFSIGDFQSSIVDLRRATFNRRHSNTRPPTTDLQPATVSPRPSADDLRRATFNRRHSNTRPPTTDLQPATVSPSTVSPRPSTNDHQPTTCNQRPATNDLQPATVSPSTFNRRPSPLAPRPSPLDPRPSTLDPRPSTLDPQRSAASFTPRPMSAAPQNASIGRRIRL